MVNPNSSHELQRQPTEKSSRTLLKSIVALESGTVIEVASKAEECPDGQKVRTASLTESTNHMDIQGDSSECLRNTQPESRIYSDHGGNCKQPSKITWS